MQARKLIRTAVLAAFAALASACVFPFNPDIKVGSEYPLVCEGDLKLGGETVIYFAYVEPMKPDDDFVLPVAYVNGFIEGEDGVRVGGVFSTGEESAGGTLSSAAKRRSSLTFDTEELSTNQKYRLHFNTLDGPGGSVVNSFESEWLEVIPAPVIDELTYVKNSQFKELQIGLSMHCEGSHYFRWSFSETYEYHSDIVSYLYYDPVSREVKTYKSGEPTKYYCWSNRESSAINIFDTSNQTDDRFEDLAFHRIPLGDIRLQVMYRIIVRLQAISDDAYDYWYSLENNTSGQGSIFSTIPSSLIGNITCVTDPTVQVLGYLSAAQQAEGVLYYNNRKENFYTGKGLNVERDDQESTTRPDEFDYWYNRGYLPYEEIYSEGFVDDPIGYKWNKARCIDCTKGGSGTKNKPADWPVSDI